MIQYPPWLYNKKAFTEEDIADYFGFVYRITNKDNGIKYIGKKQFFTIRTLPPLVGKVRKRKIERKTNWQKYFGSSKFLQADLLNNDYNCKREILILCKSKSELTYYEIQQQFLNDVLYAVDKKGMKLFYNENIAGRYFKNRIIK